MNDIAAKIAAFDDDWMPRRAKSNYSPPEKPNSVLLSEALYSPRKVVAINCDTGPITLMMLQY
jgi:hypothetical protein